MVPLGFLIGESPTQQLWLMHKTRARVIWTTRRRSACLNVVLQNVPFEKQEGQNVRVIWKYDPKFYNDNVDAIVEMVHVLVSYLYYFCFRCMDILPPITFSKKMASPSLQMVRSISERHKSDRPWSHLHFHVNRTRPTCDTHDFMTKICLPLVYVHWQLHTRRHSSALRKDWL